MLGLASSAVVGRALAEEAQLPVTMEECENTRHSCADWIFDGKKGTAEWYDAAKAELTIDYADKDTIIISRRDVQGRSAGLTAQYEGQIEGSHIHGKVIWRWPAAWGSKEPRGEWDASWEHVTAAQAIARANNANAFRNTIEVKRWLAEAAHAGDSRAQAAYNRILMAERQAAVPPPLANPNSGPGNSPMMNMLLWALQQQAQKNADCARSPACAAQQEQAEQEREAQAQEEERQRDADRAYQEHLQFMEQQNRDMSQ